MPDPAVIKCRECGFENPDARVFCRECGARLREAPAAHPGGSGVPSSSQPSRLSLAGFLPWLLRTAILAAILAALIQMLRPPAFVDRSSPLEPIHQAVLTTKLLGARTLASRADFSQAQINMWIAGRIKSSEASLKSSFDRIYVTTESGALWLTPVIRISGLRIYPSINLKPIAGLRGPELRTVGARIGRLPLPAAAGEWMLPKLEPLAAAFAPEIEILRRASGFDLAPGGATIFFFTDRQ